MKGTAVPAVRIRIWRKKSRKFELRQITFILIKFEIWFLLQLLSLHYTQRAGSSNYDLFLYTSYCLVLFSRSGLTFTKVIAEHHITFNIITSLTTFMYLNFLMRYNNHNGLIRNAHHGLRTKISKLFCLVMQQ